MRRRTVALLLALATIASGMVVVGAGSAEAAPPARDGLTQETSGASCWSIKQNFPASTDGTYWVRTKTLPQPLQVHCDMTTDGGGWVLVGRGREGWSFNYDGQQAPANVRGPIDGTAAFAPAALGTQTIDGLMNGGRMDGLQDGVRIRRARTTDGTQWQEVRLNIRNYGAWSWGFGGGIGLSRACFDASCTNIGPTDSPYASGQSTRDTGSNNNERRLTTYPQSSHNWVTGWYYGSQLSGVNDATSYLWEYSTENRAIPFAQVYIRPRISEADVAGATAPSTGLPAETIRPMLDQRPQNLPWQVTNLDRGQTSLGAYVLGFAEWNNVMFVGGKFREVQQGPGGQKQTQSYLAAFNRDTGEWIPSFRPTFNGPVWDLAVTPDGKLIVAGDFSTVNGFATTGLVALDPATGNRIATWNASVSRTTGFPYVHAIDIQGNWIYVGGYFSRVVGGTPPLNSQFGSLARLRLTDGRPDGTWKPNVNNVVWDLDASAQGDRVYTVGTMSTLNGVTLTPPRLAIMDATTGAAVPGLQPYVQNANTERHQAILEVGDAVYQGGSQHFLHKYDRSNYGFVRSHLTLRGGDYQALSTSQGILYAACHCNNWDYSDTTTWSNPRNYTRVEPINLIGAYDLNTLEFLPDFQPNIQFDGEGPWELTTDSTGCLWAGGDNHRGYSGAYYGGFQKFCPRDSVAPSAPTNFRVTAQNGDAFTFDWNHSVDNVSPQQQLKYEILRDDPELGTVVSHSKFGRGYTVSGLTEPTRFFLRGVDEAGNRSATTTAITIVPPAAQNALVPTGSTWSYDADGGDPGPGWNQAGTDVSSWPAGAAELGWGDGDEVTVIPGGAITQYFVRDIQVDDPSAYGSLRLKVRRDDAVAVYVNGTEVARDNLPAGPLSPTTLASSFLSTGEANFLEYTLPASLLQPGTNRIAAEVHQAQVNNGDGSFELELVGMPATESVPPSTPALALTNRTQTSITVGWSPATDNAAVLGYFVTRDGGEAIFQTGTGISHTGLSPATSHTYTVRAVDTSGNVSGEASLTASTLSPGNPVLLAAGSTWKYLDNGSNQGTTWKESNFDDSAWASGPALLGYGRGDEATTVGFGPNASQKHITTYFRTSFGVEEASAVQSLTLQLMRDDGAVVYINGVEVARSNMPAGTVTSATFAATNISPPAERQWNAFTVPTNVLVNGTNTLAVSVHQNFRSSPDIALDASLNATY